jgi:hypothetical protein
MRTIKIANRTEVRMTKAGNVHSADLNKIAYAYFEAAASAQRQEEFFLLMGEASNASACNQTVEFFTSMARQAMGLVA